MYTDICRLAELAVRGAGGEGPVKQRAKEVAFSLLLDLDETRERVPDGPQDRQESNRLAASEAYLTLCQAGRQRDGDTLLALLQRLAAPSAAADAAPTNNTTAPDAPPCGPPCAPMQPHAAAPRDAAAAVVSVLLALAFTAPRPPAPLIGLPSLVSPDLDCCLDRACDLITDAAAAAATASSDLAFEGLEAAAADLSQGTAGKPLPFAPAAGAAIALLGASPLVVPGAPQAQQQQPAGMFGRDGTAAAGLAVAAGGGGGGDLSWGSKTLSALLLQAGPPSKQAWGASLCDPLATAAATARAARGAALHRLATEEPTGALPALPVPGGLSSTAAAGREDASCASLFGSKAGALQGTYGKKAWGGKAGDGRRSDTAGARDVSHYKRADVAQQTAAAQGAAAVQAAAVQAGAAARDADGEAEIVAVACLALQGVCTAVAELRAIAASDAPAGLCRPTARKALVSRLLQLCEARLRLDAFVAHHTVAAAGTSGSGAASGNGGRDGVLCAFVDAVGQVLQMQASALQVLRRQAAATAASDVRGVTGCVATSAPPVTLAELLVSLEDLGAQLRDLSRLCRCGRAPANAMAAAAAPAAAVAVVPWPSELAGWAAEWGWGPSSWQVRGFVSGLQLLDGLYSELMHAPAAATPLPRFLFNAALQPLLRDIRSWAFHPSHAAAAAAAQAAAAAAADPSASGSSIGGAADGASLPVCGGSAAEKLAAAWEESAAAAPAVPAFLAGVQERLAEAGRQLQLLQLLGGAPAALARRLGVLAEAEAREAQLFMFGGSDTSTSGVSASVGATAAAAAAAAFCGQESAGGAALSAGGWHALVSGGDSSNGTGPAAVAWGCGAAGGGSEQLSLLLREGQARGGGGGGGGGQADGHAELDLGMSMDTLRAVITALEAYESLRRSEVEDMLSDLSQTRDAAAAASAAVIAARGKERAAASEAAREAALRDAAEARLRRAALLREQRGTADEQAARRHAERRAAADEERALLLTSLREERRREGDALAAELARCGAGSVSPSRERRQRDQIRSPAAASIAASSPTARAGKPGAGLGAGLILGEAAAGDRQPRGDETPSNDRGEAAFGEAVAAVISAGGCDLGSPVSVDEIVLNEEEGATEEASSGDDYLSPPQQDEEDEQEQAEEGQAQEAVAAVEAEALAEAGLTAATQPQQQQQQQQQQQRAAGISGPRLTWGMPRHPFTAAGAARGHAGGGVAASLGGGAGASAVAADARTSVGLQQQRQQPGPAAVSARWGAPRNPFPAAGAPSAVAALQTRRQQAAARSDQDAPASGGAGAAAAAVAATAGRREAGGPAAVCFGLMTADAAPLSPSGGAFNATTEAETATPGGTMVRAVTHTAGPGVVAPSRPRGAAPLPLTLEAAVAAPVAAQARLATEACWRLISDHWGLPGALRDLAHIYFQGAGDLADFLAAAAEAALADGRPPSAAVAQAALEAAVAASSCAGRGIAQELRLEVRPRRRVLPPAAPSAVSSGSGAAATAAAARRLELGDTLALAYSPPWPLRLVITPAHVEQYAEVFSALLRARRVARQLHSIWQRLSPRGGDYDDNDSKGEENVRYQRRQRLLLWVHLASHCVRCVRAFMHEQLLGGLTEALAARLGASPMTVGGMRAAHDDALAQARRFCLLAPLDCQPLSTDCQQQPNGQQQQQQQQDPKQGCKASAGPSQPPWAAPLAAEVHGLVACCWQLGCLADTWGGGSDSGFGAVGGSSGAGGGVPVGSLESDEDNCWDELEGAGAELGQRLAAVKEHLTVAAVSEPAWQGMLSRLG